MNTSGSKKLSHLASGHSFESANFFGRYRAQCRSNGGELARPSYREYVEPSLTSQVLQSGKQTGLNEGIVDDDHRRLEVQERGRQCSSIIVDDEVSLVPLGQLAKKVSLTRPRLAYQDAVARTGCQPIQILGPSNHRKVELRPGRNGNRRKRQGLTAQAEQILDGPMEGIARAQGVFPRCSRNLSSS